MESNQEIIEIKESDFEERVLKASSSSLIIVDFWAPWCGPCKQLTPILEKVIKKANGKVKLVKINIDESQQIASQLRVQSIPAVFAFKDGSPVDVFQGVIPEKKIIEFIEKSLGEKINKDHTNFYNQIKEMISNNKLEDAKSEIELFLTDNPKEFKCFALYVDCLSNMNKINDAETFVESLDEEALADKNLQASIKKLSLKKKGMQGESTESLIEKLKRDPKNLKTILELSDKYFSENNLDEAFEILLLNYKNNKDEIKIKFIEFFTALGNDNSKTQEYRKKLSSIMFS